MADRPIIFSAPMVRALLDGRKTQTRRVLKPQPVPSDFRNTSPETAKWFHDPVRGGMWVNDGVAVGPFRSPSPADRLYVREAWRAMDGQDRFSGSQIAAQCLEAGYKRAWSPIQYEVDGVRDNWIADPHCFGTEPGRYRHARHMPRWASRLTLIVTDVRVQRLQDISEADAVAEGIEATGDLDREYAAFHARTSFQSLWNSLHGPDAWGANPWCAAISFDVTRGNIDAI